MLEIQNLKKSFGSLQVLKGVNADISDGECVAIIGASGAGKSVFLRSIAMLEKPDEGQIIFDGTDLTAKGVDINKVREKMGMVYQGFYLFSHLNVLDNIILAPMIKLHKTREEAEKEAIELLEEVGLSEKAHAMPQNLSGGQKQRIAIARCLAMHPSVILFDEPTSALDPGMTREVLAIIRKLLKRSLTMVLVTHEMDFAKEAASRIIFMENGVVAEQGSAKIFFEHPTTASARAFLEQQKNYSFKVESRHFDFAVLMSGLQLFGEKYNLSRKQNMRIQLLMEEVMAVFCACYVDDTFPHISGCVQYSEKNGKLTLRLDYDGGQFNPLKEDKDDLRHVIISSICSGNVYTSDSGRNTLTLIIKDERDSSMAIDTEERKI